VRESAVGQERDRIQRDTDRDYFLSAEEARSELMAHVEKDARLHAAQLTREIESEAKRNADATARSIIVTSMQRLAAEQTTESVVASVPLPSDD